MIDIGKDLANAYEEGMRDARAKIDNEVFELQTEVKRLERICHSYALQYGTVTSKDVAEVVRCKDCRHCDIFYPMKYAGMDAIDVYFCAFHNGVRQPDDFCSYGERKV